MAHLRFMFPHIFVTKIKYGEHLKEKNKEIIEHVSKEMENLQFTQKIINKFGKQK